MNTFDCIKARHSCRKFLPKMVEKEKLQKVVEAGLLAPTGSNSQKVHILMITNKEIRDELSRLNAKIMGREGIDPFYGAPAVALVYVDASAHTAVYDGSLCLGYMLLEATELGLGNIWVHRGKEELESEEGKAILKKLGIEGDYIGIGHCCLGYEDGEPVAPEKDLTRVKYAE